MSDHFMLKTNTSNTYRDNSNVEFVLDICRRGLQTNLMPHAGDRSVL